MVMLEHSGSRVSASREKTLRVNCRQDQWWYTAAPPQSSRPYKQASLCQQRAWHSLAGALLACPVPSPELPCTRARAACLPLEHAEG